MAPTQNNNRKNFPGIDAEESSFVHHGACTTVHPALSATASASALEGAHNAVDVTNEIKSAADALQDSIAVLDAALVRIDEGLNRSQPAGSGKIRIHFEKARGIRPTPILIVWRKSSKSKKWWGARLPWKNAASRAKFVGGFAENHRQTQALLAESARLIVLRQEMLAKRRSILLSLRFGAERLRREADLAVERADQWHAECEENLAIRRG